MSNVINENVLALIKGDKGEKGNDGTGITDVTLTDDGGLDFTLSDGSHLYTASVKGNTGATGEDGKDALVYNSIYSSNIFPNVGTSVTLYVQTFNRTPVVGEYFTFVYEQSGTNRSFICMGLVQSVNIETDTASINIRAKVETTGEKGDDGSISNADILSKVYPVGSIYISYSTTSPASFLGGTWEYFAGGRTLVGRDTSGSDVSFVTTGNTGGEKTHTLTVSEMPSHTHTQNQHRHNNSAHSTAANHKLLSVNSWSANTIGMQYNDNASGVGAIEVSSGSQTYQTYFKRGNMKAVSAASFYSDYATAVNQNTGGGTAHNNLPPYIVVNMWRRTA